MYASISVYGISSKSVLVDKSLDASYINITFLVTPHSADSLIIGLKYEEAEHLYALLGQSLQEAARAMQEVGQDTPGGYDV